MTPRSDLLGAIQGVFRHGRATRREIRAYQDRQLRRLVAHAYENVPYYRRLFDREGLKPQDVRSTADLSLIPISSKRDLRAAAPGDIVARGHRSGRLIVSRTSGSSGEPFQIQRTWLEQNLLHLFKLRGMRHIGWRATDRTALVAAARPAHARDNKLLGRGLAALGLCRSEHVELFRNPAEIMADLRAMRPDVIAAYPGVLLRLGDHLGDKDRARLGVRLLVSGAEVLTAAMRRRISAAFGVPVRNMYGSHEFNLLAWECRDTGEMHTCDDALVLEVVRNGRPVSRGEEGEVVVTALHSYAMPFLRYRLADLVTKGEACCSCGRPFGTIRAVQGRMLDLFRLPGGRVLHPCAFVTRLLDSESEWIRRYQLVQDRTDRITLQVVSECTPTPEMLGRMHCSAAALLGPGVHFDVVTVPELYQEPSGKIRMARSLLASEGA